MEVPVLGSFSKLTGQNTSKYKAGWATLQNSSCPLAQSEYLWTCWLKKIISFINFIIVKDKQVNFMWTGELS